MPSEHHISVSRSARYFMLGQPGPGITDIWFCCHGYAQLASDFAREFECIAAPGRLIVVPEALSRFYVPSGTGFHGPDTKVGATWMTRDDREHEIVDYVNYLDRLYDEVIGALDRTKLRVNVLGFSQGGATVNRWLTRGKAKADRLIMWGSLLASDADLNEAAEFFRNTELTIVYGTRDQFGDTEMIAGYENLLKEKGIAYSLLTFNGGHRMDRETLKHLASVIAPGSYDDIRLPDS
ncbi:MAG: phospholipase [Gemmatimonadaceae bacterium]